VRVPSHTDDFKIGWGKASEPAKEYRFLGRDDSVEPGDGALDETCGLPLRDHYVHGTTSQTAGNPANEGVLTEIEKDEGRAQLKALTIGERKPAEVNLAEHRYSGFARES